jgi:hypothetical protein
VIYEQTFDNIEVRNKIGLKVEKINRLKAYSPGNTKKVVWIGHESTLNGSERCFLESVTTLIKAGYIIYVFLPRDGDLVNELKKEGVENINIIEYEWWKPSFFGNNE